MVAQSTRRVLLKSFIMVSDFTSVFDALKPVLSGCSKRLAIKSDTPTLYMLDAKAASPFPQHKGQPLSIAAIRIGKAYVSLHLMPLYMCPKLNEGISPELKKRMQGKACFNFKTVPEKSLLTELKQLTKTCLDEFDSRGWL